MNRFSSFLVYISKRKKSQCHDFLVSTKTAGYFLSEIKNNKNLIEVDPVYGIQSESVYYYITLKE